MNDIAFGYVRVSTEEQAKKGISLDVQRGIIQEYCKANQLNLVNTFSDEGQTGSIIKGRDGITDLLKCLRRNEAQHLVIYTVDRLSRNLLDLLIIERELTKRQIVLHTRDGIIDTSNTFGFLYFVIVALISEIERRLIQDRTKSALSLKKERHEIISRLPYGYKRKGKQLIKNRDEQKVIKAVNELYKSGASLTRIKTVITNYGTRSRSGKDFDTTQIKRMIAGYQRTR